jgi:hypothetical protein
LCTLCCQFLWIVHFWLALRCSLTFIYYALNFNKIGFLSFVIIFYPTKHVSLVPIKYHPHHLTIKSNLLTPWYRWIISHLALNNNHFLATSISNTYVGEVWIFVIVQNKNYTKMFGLWNLSMLNFLETSLYIQNRQVFNLYRLN